MVDRPFAFFIYFFVKKPWHSPWSTTLIDRYLEFFFHSIEITNLYFKIRSEPQAKIMTWFCVYIFQKNRRFSSSSSSSSSSLQVFFYFYFFVRFMALLGLITKFLYFFLLLNAASFGGNYSIRRPLTHYNMCDTRIFVNEQKVRED